jgi:selenocysteine lyase/cysteine desulfurase
MLAQMATVRLPAPMPDLGTRLFADNKIEVNVAGDLLRVSIAAYTTDDDVDRLLEVLSALIQ